MHTELVITSESLVLEATKNTSDIINILGVFDFKLLLLFVYFLKIFVSENFPESFRNLFKFLIIFDVFKI